MPTNIPYLDEVWQPVTGCTPCSPGCENCYAAVQASGPRLRDHRRYTGLAVGGKWTGEVRCNEDTLTQPLRWRIRRVVGVCFMGDLFHPDVPIAFLDKVFDVMRKCERHTFIVCTKRAIRMREFLSIRRSFSNVQFGVTVESRDHIDRAYHLFMNPQAQRWLSLEPLLGDPHIMPALHRGGISAVVIGCESGPNRRPCKLEWVRQVVEDCAAAGVKCYVKQLDIGGKVVTDMAKFPEDLRVRQLPWEITK